MVLNYYISILADKEISICNKPIILYRGDCNVELQFELRHVEDLVNEVGAEYAQLLISMPDGDVVNITSIDPIVDGKIKVFIIAQDIDEIIELGDYDFQIRLFDSELRARLTLPPVLKGLRVREPIVSDSTLNVSRTDESYLLAISEPEETFTGDSYNKTEWEMGEIITSSRMNKIEDGIYQVNEKVNNKVDADYVSENCALKTDIPSLEDYATKDYVGGKIAEAQLGGGTGGDGEVNIDLSVYALKSDVPKKVSQLENDKGYLTQHQSLTGYATEDFVESKIEEAQLNGEDVDLTGYATEDFVNEAIADAQLSGGNVDLSGYAKITDIPTNVSQLKNDSGFLTQHQSLENYATKAYVDTKIADAQLSGGNVDLSGYAKTTDIPTNISQLRNDIGYLTQHQSLEDYATKDYVDDKIVGVTRIEVVDELPGTEETGVLYIVKGK